MITPTCNTLKLISKITLLILAMAGMQPLHANQVSTSIDPAKILMGEHAVITFSLEVSEKAEVQFPLFNDTITANIEIITYGQAETITGESPGMVRMVKKLTVTSWQEGFHPIVPFSFNIIENNDTVIVESQAVLLEVQGVLLDEAAQLKDIKGILRIPIAVSEILPWALLSIVILIVAFVLYRFLKNRKKQPVKQAAIEKPEIPAHLAALNSLENLKARKLWQQGFVKDYYVELSIIIRLYLEKRFGVSAIEMTTGEIMSALNGTLESDGLFNNLNSILQLADMVKFAKYIPDSIENDWSIDTAVVFVRNTSEVESILAENNK